MIYLFLGNNIALKIQKIDEIKSKYLLKKEALHFDYELLYADKLDADDLKKALLNLPAFSKKRIVVLKNIEKLKADNQKIIAAFLVEKDAPAVLILDSDSADLKTSFINDIKRVAKVEIVGETLKASVFDLTNCLQRHQPASALKILSELMEQGNHPLQIMGALLWFWGTKNKVSRQHFQKGLEFLQEADLNIKRSRLDPGFAVEKLVVSLSSLLT